MLKMDHKLDSKRLKVCKNGYFWLLAWFALNIAVTIMNKAFFSFWEFPYPALLSSIHMAASFACGSIYMQVFRIRRLPAPSVSQSILFRFSLIFTANIVLGNYCLKFTTVSLVQVVRSIIPGITIVLSMIMLGKRYKVAFFYAVMLIVSGVALAAAGELEAEALSYIGIMLTIGVSFLSSLKSVLSSKFLSKMGFHPMDLLTRMSGYATLQLLFCAWAFGEIDDLFVDMDSMNPKQIYWLVSALLMNGFFAFALNFTNFMTTNKTSALTVTIAGNLKHIATIMASIAVFDSSVTLMNGLGILLSSAGGAVYSYLEYTESTTKGQQDSPEKPLIQVVVDSQMGTAGVNLESSDSDSDDAQQRAQAAKKN